MVRSRTFLFDNRLINNLKLDMTDIKVSSNISGRNLLRFHPDKQREKISDASFNGIIFVNQDNSVSLSNNESPQMSPFKQNEENAFNNFATNKVPETDIVESLDICESVICGKEDENSNNIIKEDHVIVNQKKKSAVHSFKNFVRGTIIPMPSETKEWLGKQPSDCAIEMENCVSNKEQSSSIKTEDVPRRKKLSSVINRNKKTRSRIHNEGASLWTPVENSRWKSGEKVVELKDISLHQLTESEREKLKQYGLERLRENNFDCHLIIPKDTQVAARRRWKKLMILRKKAKNENNEKASPRPFNPVFSVDLNQVIENDKLIEKAQKEAMQKLDKNEELGENFETNDKDQLNKDSITRTKVCEEAFTTEDHEDYNLNYFRTICTLQEEDEDEWSTNKRKSRLIEALALSSTSASSLCILDKEIEFKQLPLQIPKVILQTTEFITKFALNTVGIFRTGGSKKRVTQMKSDYDRGFFGVINGESNPNDVAALLKEFLRCLPDPLLTRELYQVFLSLAKKETQTKDEKVEIIQQLIWLLPVANRDTLECLLNCLRMVADHSQNSKDEFNNEICGNKMDSLNLATLMAPNILHRCKTYKSSNAYQVDEALNPDDNKASIEIVTLMIDYNKELFKISASTHDKILRMLLVDDPETIDYVLRKKPTVEQELTKNGIQTIPKAKSIKRISSFDERIGNTIGTQVFTCTDDNKKFEKSNSFNGYLRMKRNSTNSRPSSTRSDPNDRNSVRKSLNEPSPRRRKRSAFLGELEAFKRNSSPRDSGVVLTSIHCVQDDDRLLVDIKDKRSYSESVVLRRENFRERDSYDSAYNSGINNFRMSELGSVRVSQEVSELTSLEMNENTEKLRLTFLNEVLESPPFLSPQLHVKKKETRKISMPILPNKEYFPLHRQKEISLDGIPSISFDNEWDPVLNWPYWRLPSVDSQMPSQETDL
ncbi:uncharacterized protein LOC100215916 [Hydra vulgaris]|uniref:Uncharacterized protein LOC100215916 n=1 Tax=Hydra vulgaris TaxID=6087 RepID=A0ABM4D8F3_HYDVU